LKNNSFINPWPAAIGDDQGLDFLGIESNPTAIDERPEA